MITRSTLFERFAGRDEELRFLIDAQVSVRKNLHGRTISIGGEAGVGKSRLLREFEAASGPARRAFVRARCAELPLAYAPFVAVLQALAERRELRASAEIASAVEALTTADAVRDPDSAERRRARIDPLLVALAFAAKRLGQLTLVIEDVHWADLSSMAALIAVAKVSARAPLLTIVTYRPSDLGRELARATAFAAFEREGVDRVVLDPLPHGDLVPLLRDLLPDASATLIRRIYELSEGKPYVAEELARSVVERGGDVEFEPTLSLRSAVLERVGGLEPQAREIVNHAAVLGRNFAADDLRAFGATSQSLISAFRAAVDLQLLEEHETAGSSSFRFRHALTREILYRDLLALERRELHARFAAYLETCGNRTGELAYHLSAAGDAERALVANEHAGNEAIGIAAFADAAAFFARAISYARDTDDNLATLALKRAEALDWAGDLDGLLATSEPDAVRLEKTGKPDAALAVLIVAVRTISRTRLAEALPLLAHAQSLIRDATPPDLRFDFEMLCAIVLRLQSRTHDALGALERARAAIVMPSEQQRNDLLLSEAHTYLRLNDLANAARALDGRLQNRGIGSAANAAHAQTLGSLAMVAYRRGQTRVAFEQSLEAASIWRELNREHSASRAECNAAYYASELGDFAFVEGALERTKRGGMEMQQALVAAQMRRARAIGADPEPFAQRFAREIASGTPYLAYMLARDLPWMLPDRKRAAEVVRAALAIIPAKDLEGDILEAVVEFGTDDEVASTFAAVETAAFGADDLLHAMDISLARARLARRKNRDLECAQLATRALELAERSRHWLSRGNALALLGRREEMLAAFASVGAHGEASRVAGLSIAQAPGRPLPELTSREEQVARLIAAGLTNKEAAERLAIGPRTVEAHLANLYTKLGIGSRTELAAYLRTQ